MAISLPPLPLFDIAFFPFPFQDWLRKINQIITTSGISWLFIDFTGSNLIDIETRNHNDLQNIQGGSSTERYHLTSAQNAKVVAFDESAQDAVGNILTDTNTIDLTYTDATPSITADVKTNSISVGFMHSSTTDVVFGRSSASAGAGEEIVVTSAGRALIDDVSASAQRTTLGLGSGLTTIITTAPLTGGGTVGSQTFTNGILTAQTQAT